MKYLILESEKLSNSILKYLVDKKSLPTIHRRLNIFAEDDSLQIEILDDKLSYKNKNQIKSINVKNKNLKYFFKGLDNSIKYYINDIVLFQFEKCSFLFDTYHGNIVSLDEDDLCEEIAKTFNLKIYNNIHEHIINKELISEYLFDEIGNLNSKIKSYGIKTGLDIRSSSSSLKLRLSNISNDYSYLESFYKKIIGTNLLSFHSSPEIYGLKNMSIIIPVYNQDVSYTLLSIQGQNLTKEEKSKLQVIVINDGSSSNILNDINPIKNLLDYEIEIITLEQNMGLSNARNIGYAISKYDLVLFMDSDIILSKNYLKDINIRMQIIPNAVFVAMRKNIEKNDDLLVKENLLSGTAACNEFDDSRVITKSKEYHIGWDKAYIGEEITILDDTDNFKELGFGSSVGIYNIATVVAGHNMALNKSAIKFTPAFCTSFHGWGMEDAYFASRLVSHGCYVIPILSSCVYHINHPPRSGSVEQKTKEASKNYALYNKLLDENWD